jgi:thiol-disulfide isomerase/thioredoxin
MANEAANGLITKPERDASGKPRRNLLWFGAIAGTILVGAVLAIALLSGGGNSAPGAASSAADTAPDFSFTLYQGQGKLGGDTLTLSDLQGRPVVVNFWAGLCPPCRAEMPDLQSFYEEFNDRVDLVGVDLGQFTGLGSQRDAQDLLTSLEVTYPAGFTSDASVISRYQVLSMPTTVFINSKGEIFKKWSGALTGDVLAKVTEDMLSQESTG